MRNSISMSMAGAALLAFVPAALAQTTADVPAPVEHATVTGQSDNVVCVHSEPPTGSRFGAKKVCHTTAEWRNIHANAQDSMHYLQDRQDNMVEGAALAAGAGH